MQFIVLLVLGAFVAVFVAYNAFHFALYLLATHPRNARRIGRELNEFEQRQLVEWTPTQEDYLYHDDQGRTYDDVFAAGLISRKSNYSTCVFPRWLFDHPYVGDRDLLDLRRGMRLLDLGCGTGEAARYFASQEEVEVVCVTNSRVQAEICREKFASLDGRATVVVQDFDTLALPDESFDVIYSFESIGYSKDLDAWLANCHRMLAPGGKLLIRTPGSVETCRRERDYELSTLISKNWKYNFVGANILVHKLRGLGFQEIAYRQVPFGLYSLTANFLTHYFLWVYTLKVRTMVELGWIMWRISKRFLLGNPYNIVLARK